MHGLQHAEQWWPCDQLQCCGMQDMTMHISTAASCAKNNSLLAGTRDAALQVSVTCCYIGLLLCQLCTSHACDTLPEAAVQLAAVVPQQLADVVAVACLPLYLRQKGTAL
jgi:hypothetical protein